MLLPNARRDHELRRTMAKALEARFPPDKAARPDLKSPSGLNEERVRQLTTSTAVRAVFPQNASAAH